MMEKISRKLEQSKGNSFLLHQVFSDVEHQLTNKLIELDHKDGEKIIELTFLWNHCGDPDYAVAFEASHAVLNLTFNGHLGINESITALLSSAATARHYGLLTDTVAQLMLRGSYRGGRHPFISLYEMQPDSWPYIMQQISNIISCGMFEVQALKEIKPFVIYILCHGRYEARTSLLCTLVGKLHVGKNPLIIDWLLETLVWQHQQNHEKISSNFHLMCVQQLCDYAITQKGEDDLASILAILLISAMQTCHNKFGFGIHHCVFLLKQLIDNCALEVEPIVVMVGQFLLGCHANCYEPLLDFCRSLAKKHCNPYVWGILQCAVLPIFPYSTKLESNVMEIVESTPTPFLASDKALSDSTKSTRYIHYLSRSESSIQIALATAELAKRFEHHLPQNLSDSCRSCDRSSLSDAIFLLNCAVFWRSGHISALEAAVEYVSSTKLYAKSLLTLLLKKLTTPSNGKAKLAILYHLPSLAIDKTCVPRVLQIFEALSSSPQLRPVRTRLLAELWKVEDRVYPYLEKVLNTDQQQTEEFLIAKATAIDIICKNRSDKYGAELLSIISDLLNSSLGKISTVSSATIATLSLRSLVSLCRAEVVDLKSVWDLLAPKLNQDNRTSVVSEVCHLLGLTAELRIDNEEYDEFIHQAITTLFRISTTASSPEARCIALRSLSRFPKKDFNLKCMPDSSKDDLKVPAKYLPPGKTETVIKAEDVLDYLPGLCWMKLMDFYDDEIVMNGFTTLLSHLIEEEIRSMPIWIYKKAANDATKKNEPSNYSSSLKEDSVLAALVVYMQRICEINSVSRVRMSVAFKVLGGPFERPLPPLNWMSLLPIAQQYNLEPEFMEIVFSQVPHSFSAQTIAENVFAKDPLDGRSAVVALSYLGSICKALPVKSVQEFLYVLLDNEQTQISVILTRLRHSLNTVDPQIPAEVKETIANILVKLFPILADDFQSLKHFASCFCLVSGAHRSLCVPSTSTAKKLIATLLFASNESHSKAALEFLLKALQLALYLPQLDNETTELVHQCIGANFKSSHSFLLQFMSYIQLTAMKPLAEDQNFLSLMDLFALVVGVISDTLVFHRQLSKDDQSKKLRENLWEYFSLGMSHLFGQPQWAVVKKNMQDWILTMLDNEYVNTELRGRLLDVLPSTIGIDKEVFIRILAI
uniref:RE24967p n=1 Tax=Daphnia magna TaxID=35525 RepID=A0A0P5JGL1_9CRUS